MPGTVLKRTELKRMMDDGGEAIVRVVIAKAQAGDLDAAQLVLARISPPARPQGEHVSFRFDLHAPLMEQAQQVVAAVANGELTVEAGHMLIQCLSNAAGLKAVDVLAARVEALEGKGRTGALGASMVLDATMLPLPGTTTQQ